MKRRTRSFNWVNPTTVCALISRCMHPGRRVFQDAKGAERVLVDDWSWWIKLAAVAHIQASSVTDSSSSAAVFSMPLHLSRISACRGVNPSLAFGCQNRLYLSHFLAKSSQTWLRMTVGTCTTCWAEFGAILTTPHDRAPGKVVLICWICRDPRAFRPLQGC